MKNHSNSGLDQPGLFRVYPQDQLIAPTAQDLAVAETYLAWPDKGKVIDGRRLTILSKKQTYKVNEEVRVIHVQEETLPGRKLYLMGPKRIHAEYINGHNQMRGLSSDQVDPFTPEEYDGRTLDSPGIDSNFEITVYSFEKPGQYKIRWQPGKWKSNILEIEVLE